MNPIHYAWEIYQQDSLVLRYLSTEEFHFAEPDVVGGPAAAIHRYEARQEGVHQLVFYNPFYNQEQLVKEQEADDPYLIWKALKEDFSAYDTLTDWKRSAFEAHWMALQATEGTSQDSLWEAIYQATYTVDSVPDSTTVHGLLIKWAAVHTPFTNQAVTLELLDTLLGAAKEPRRQTWHDLRQQQDKHAPLHARSNPKTYYVRVSSK